MESNFERAYNSFSGVDMKVVSGDKVLSNLQAISVSVTREKAPIYTMGSADPRSFSRGKRGIVGTMIFIVFDRHFLLDPTYGLGSSLPWLDKEEANASWAQANPNDDLSYSFGALVGEPVEQAEDPLLGTAGSDQIPTNPQYVDQILPFDVVLVGANEYGKRMKMAVGGIELLNEGSGFSIDDIQTEQQTTYVARSILPWVPTNPEE